MANTLLAKYELGSKRSSVQRWQSYTELAPTHIHSIGNDGDRVEWS